MSISVACVGGTAAYDLLQEGALLAERLGRRRTPFGESQPIYVCKTRLGEYYFMSRHGESGYQLAPSFINYRANIYALKDIGVRAVVSWSETRAISHNFKIGQFVLPNDLIDETNGRANTFFENQGLGVVRQWPVFCPSVSAALATAMVAESCLFGEGGVYLCVEGPRRETPAEVRKYAGFGAELLGATLAPEVFLAKELQMCYASICYVASYAENGSDFKPFENGRVLDVETQRRRAIAAVEQMPRILERLCDVLDHTPSMCHCETAMQHHVASGQIDWDWRSWFRNETPSATRRSERSRNPDYYEVERVRRSVDEDPLDDFYPEDSAIT